MHILAIILAALFLMVLGWKIGTMNFKTNNTYSQEEYDSMEASARISWREGYAQGREDERLGKEDFFGTAK